RLHRTAFTLIEMAAVMTIIAILAVAVGGPTMSYISTQRSRWASARVATDLTYLQRLAMNSRRRTWASFDVANNRYTLYVEDPANPGKSNRMTLANPLTGANGAVQLGSGDFSGASFSTVSFNSGSELEFSSRGRPYDSSSSILTSDGSIAF